jgi:hypothetical protein
MPRPHPLGVAEVLAVLLATQATRCQRASVAQYFGKKFSNPVASFIESRAVNQACHALILAAAMASTALWSTPASSQESMSDDSTAASYLVGPPAANETAAPLSDTPTQPPKQGFWQMLHDPKDGDIDASDWLLQRKGALLVPIIITEPAIGTGGGVAAVFFHRPKQSDESKDKGERLPPDLYGVAAFKTENGTYGYGAGGSFHFKDDTWRYAGIGAKASINLDFYTQGNLFAPQAIGYNLNGIFLYQQVSRRIGDTPLFASARWIYMDIDSRLNIPSERQFFDSSDFARRASGLGLGIEYDTRDNTLSPTQGWLWKLEGTAYEPAFGSDNTFQSYRAKVFGYFHLGDRWLLAARADYRSAHGNVPFYQLPSIDLRGIPFGRYQDDNVGMLEAELGWMATPRWTLLAFTGAGRAWGRKVDFGDSTTRTTDGFGFRYLIASALGLRVGVDWAWGPDDHAFYIQMGSAWR